MHNSSCDADTRKDQYDSSVSAALTTGIRRIPYIPILKDLCHGSLRASILLQQQEHWFSYKPEGFYKFLKPCAHDSYKPGDSWTEELEFSAKEFRAAFDCIGIRYKSKRAMNDYLKPFLSNQHKPTKAEITAHLSKGKFYYSVFDVKKGLTYYFRNHQLIQESLKQLFERESSRKISQVIEKYEDDLWEYPDSTKGHLHNRPKVISRTDRRESSYKEHKNTTEITTKKTTASSNVKSQQNSIAETENKTAAAFSINSKIGKELDEGQKSKIKIIVDKHISSEQLSDREAIICSFESTIIDLSQFPRTGTKFEFKLNTLAKLWKEGRFNPLEEQIQRKQDAEKSALSLQEKNLQELRLRLQEATSTVKQSEEYLLLDPANDDLVRLKEKDNAALDTIREQYKSLKAEIDNQKGGSTGE